jgi:hypothetical protein
MQLARYILAKIILLAVVKPRAMTYLSELKSFGNCAFFFLRVYLIRQQWSVGRILYLLSSKKFTVLMQIFTGI